MSASGAAQRRRSMGDAIGVVEAKKGPPSRAALDGGAKGIRTPDLLIANETRYQLRHSPIAPQGATYRVSLGTRRPETHGRLARCWRGLTPPPTCEFGLSSREDVDHEHKRRARGDRVALTGVAISKLRRDHQENLAADRLADEALHPAIDQCPRGDREGRR